MELITTTLIERIRKALIKRYDRDQQIQQMIEEIGTEEGLNETELAIVYQAYLEVKERVYYTSTLVDLWNQIDEVQNRMALLHTYESLEQDLFGDVVGHAYDDGGVAHGIGKGVNNHHDAYAMEEVQLEDVPLQHDTTVGVNHIKLNELHAMGGLFTGAGESIEKNADMDDLDEASIEHMHAEPLQGVESLETKHVHDSADAFKENKSSLSEHKKSNFDDEDSSNFDDEDNTNTFDIDGSYDGNSDFKKTDSEDESDDDVSIDPFTAVNALLFGKSDMDRKKGQKKLEKLIKKQLKRVDKEWARINGTDGKSKKSKDKKEKDKKDKKKKDKKDKLKKSKNEKSKDKKDKKDKSKKDKSKKSKDKKFIFKDDIFKSKDKKAKDEKFKSKGDKDKSKKDGKGEKK